MTTDYCCDDEDGCEDGCNDGPYYGLQEMIDSGLAWRLEGSVGRSATAAIQAGECMLGPVACFDAYGNRIPARHEVRPGTPGSPEWCDR